MKPLIFDIETEPLDEQSLRELCPVIDESEFEVGEFDPSSVKLGNLKDEAKIEAKIEAKRAEHKALQDSSKQRCEAARKEQWEKFLSGATLNAAYSRTLAIGFYSLEKDRFICSAVETGEVDEGELLRAFWYRAVQCIQNQRKMIGINIFSFDLPYLFRRSSICGIEVPNAVLKDRIGKWPAWHPTFVDLRKVWLNTSSYNDAKSSYQTLAHAFRTGGKVTQDDIKGGDFWKFWRGTPEQREVAMAYLEQDVRQPAVWAERMGIV